MLSIDGMDRTISPQTRIRERLNRGARPLLIALALALAAVWTASALRPGLALDEVRLGTVRLGDLEASVTALGTVQPAAERLMASPVDARLLQVLKRPGSVVEAGDQIVRLDLGAIELESKQLEGRLTQARARRLERELTLQKEETDLDGRLSIAELELEEARFGLEQSRRLRSEGLISLSTLRAAETRQKRLEIQIQGLEKTLLQAKAAAAAQLAGLDAEISSLIEERSQAASVLERAIGRAESAGVLTWVLDEEGAAVGRGDPLARLADLASFRIEATISQIHAQRLETGQAVRIPLADEILSGVVQRVLPAVEEGVLRFDVELDRPDHPALRANQRLDVQVITATRRGVLTLERGSLSGGGRVHDVFVINSEGTHAQRRRIELGHSSERIFEIASGLEAGERVILTNLSRFEGVNELRLR